MAANASIEITGSAVYTKITTLATYSGTPRISETLSLETSAISKVYSTTGTIAAATDFNVSSLTDVYGASVSIGTVKGVLIKNTHASATLTVGAGTNPLFGSDQYTVKAGHVIAITSPFTVTTNVTLRLTPSASCTYELLIVGS